MLYDDTKNRRGRKATRPDTPSVLRERARAKELYYGRPSFDSWSRSILSTIYSRAKKRGIYCDLTKQDLKEMIEEIGYTCPSRLIKLVMTRGRGVARDDSPSVDRIDHNGPYTRVNCCILSFRANTAKSRLSIDDIGRLYAYLVQRSK